MNLVFQVSIPGDESGNLMFSYRSHLYTSSCVSALKYSNRCHASYFCLRNKILDILSFHPWQRYVIFTDEIYDRFENILYVDSDVIIKPDAENVFERFSNRGFCATPVLYTNPDLEKPRLNNILRQCNKYNIDLNCYFNSGVFLVDKKTRIKIRELNFLNYLIFPEDNNDQPTINKLILDNDLFYRLDWKFNFLCKKNNFNSPRKEEAYFIHYLEKDLFEEV